MDSHDARTETTSAEQQARDMLERMGVEGAQQRSAGDVCELANLIADFERVKRYGVSLAKGVEASISEEITEAIRRAAYPQLRTRIVDILRAWLVPHGPVLGHDQYHDLVQALVEGLTEVSESEPASEEHAPVVTCNAGPLFDAPSWERQVSRDKLSRAE